VIGTTEATVATHRENVLFVCLHGSAKSLIAAECFNRLAAARGLGARAASAGIEPDDAIPPRVAQGLRDDGVEVGDRRPRRPTPGDVEGAAIVVTFGCDLGDLAARASRIERWDDVPAVSEDFKRARDVIAAHVAGLLEDPAIRR
jgi:arsenate reductase